VVETLLPQWKIHLAEIALHFDRSVTWGFSPPVYHSLEDYLSAPADMPGVLTWGYTGI
jgi:hypothetical protein